MFTILKKELSSFMTSLIGYITIIVFLLVNALLLWGINSGVNVFDSALATLNGLFFISPWIFLFLIPAITMKMFAEILLTKPVSDISIIMGKFLAALIIVLLSVLPTMVYMICIYELGSPKGNLDVGGILGSYLGLLFLGGIFASVGIFCSSLTNSQIVAFILSALMCLTAYIGFDFIAQIPFLSNFDLTISKLGIANHYESISIGVIDSRDVIYFLSITAFFILLTKISLESRNWKK